MSLLITSFKVLTVLPLSQFLELFSIQHVVLELICPVQIPNHFKGIKMVQQQKLLQHFIFITAYANSSKEYPSVERSTQVLILVSNLLNKCQMSTTATVVSSLTCQHYYYCICCCCSNLLLHNHFCLIYRGLDFFWIYLSPENWVLS